MRVAVIGANYGDEGKGLTTDALVRRFGPSKTTVIRHNGGAQAGHTVVDGDRRHVFGHVGSGYFAGSHTHLSRFFVSNPLVLAKETASATLGFLAHKSPYVSADPRGEVTTHWDMLINQTRARGHNATCGVGIDETLRRAHSGFSLKVGDLSDTAKRNAVMALIARDWVPKRLRQLNALDAEDIERALNLAPITDQFLQACDYFARVVDCHLTDDVAVQMSDHVVCEGAQGLLLDQTRGHFPFVTRSNTGLLNARAICGHIDHAYYVTRWYLTRHGDGPLPGEMPDPPHAKIDDKTNVHNRYQGALRFALLNVTTLQDRIWIDAENASASIVVTCLDQCDGTVDWYSYAHNVAHGPVKVFIDQVQDKDLPVSGLSYGPSAKDLHWR